MTKNKKKIIIAMKKAKTSLERVLKMINQDKYCIDTIQQSLAVIGLLKSANMQILEEHTNCCIKNACKNNNKKEIEEKMSELIYIFKLAQKK